MSISSSPASYRLTAISFTQQDTLSLRCPGRVLPITMRQVPWHLSSWVLHLQGSCFPGHRHRTKVLVDTMVSAHTIVQCTAVHSHGVMLRLNQILLDWSCESAVATDGAPCAVHDHGQVLSRRLMQ
jgi:hypothetical protein